MNKKFLRAARDGDIGTLRALYKKSDKEKININFQSSNIDESELTSTDRDEPLDSSGPSDLEGRSDISASSSDNRQSPNALAYAVKNNHINCVEFLLGCKGIQNNIVYYDTDNEIIGTPMHIAAHLGYCEIIKLLFNSCNNENSHRKQELRLSILEGEGKDTLYSPLLESVLGLQYDAFQLLIRLGADIMVKTPPDVSMIGVPENLNLCEFLMHQLVGSSKEADAEIVQKMHSYLVSHMTKKGPRLDFSSADSDSSDARNSQSYQLSDLYELLSLTMMEDKLPTYLQPSSILKDKYRDYGTERPRRRSAFEILTNATSILSQFNLYSCRLEVELMADTVLSTFAADDYNGELRERIRRKQQYDRHDCPQLLEDYDVKSSCSDSDSEAASIYESKPLVLRDLTSGIFLSGKEYVPSYRGHNHAKKFKDADGNPDHKKDAEHRKNQLEISKAGILQDVGIFSADAHNKTGIPFDLPKFNRKRKRNSSRSEDSFSERDRISRKLAKRQKLLEPESTKINTVLKNCEQSGPVKPSLWERKPKEDDFFSSQLVMLFQKYANTYAAFNLAIQKNNVTDMTSLKSDRKRAKASLLSYFKNNPFISTSENVVRALQYATGILNYTPKLHRPDPEDPSKAFVLMPRYNSMGYLKHPYLGEIYVVLHTPEELARDSRSILELFSLDQIALKRGPIGNIRDFERIFISHISSDRVCLAMPVRLPNLYHEYRPFIKDKYGIDENTYNAFKRRISRYSRISRDTGKRVNEDGYYQTQESIIEKVIDHVSKGIENALKAWGLKNNIRIGSLDIHARFSEDLMNASQKLEMATELRKKCIAFKEKMRSTGFMSHDVPADGNCFFHAISDQLKQKGVSISHADIRAGAVNYIRNHMYEYQSYILGDINQWLDANSTAGTWADEHMIMATARAYNINIHIMRSDNAEPNKMSVNDEITKTVYIGYITGLHYTSLVRQDDHHEEIQVIHNTKLTDSSEGSNSPSLMR